MWFNFDFEYETENEETVFITGTIEFYTEDDGQIKSKNLTVNASDENGDLCNHRLSDDDLLNIEDIVIYQAGYYEEHLLYKLD